MKESFAYKVIALPVINDNYSNRLLEDSLNECGKEGFYLSHSTPTHLILCKSYK